MVLVSLSVGARVGKSSGTSDETNSSGAVEVTEALGNNGVAVSSMAELLIVPADGAAVPVPGMTAVVKSVELG